MPLDSLSYAGRLKLRFSLACFLFLFSMFPWWGVDALLVWPRVLVLAALPAFFAREIVSGLQRSSLALRPDLAWLGAFLIWALACSLASGVPEVWWGAPEKRTGYLVVLAFACAYAVASWLPSSSWGGRSFAICSALLSGLTVAEFLGLRPLSLLYIGVETAWPASVVGHRGQLAGLLLILLFDGARRALHDGRKGWLALVFLLSAALACCSNSSAILALLVALALWCWASISQPPAVRSRSWLLAALILLGCFARVPLQPVNAALIRQGIVAERAQAKDLSSTFTLAIRLRLWSSSARLIGQRPLLGWGPDAFERTWYLPLSHGEWSRIASMELGTPETDIISTGGDHVVRLDEGIRVHSRLHYTSPHNSILELLLCFGLPGAFLFFAFLRSCSLRILSRRGLVGLIPFAAYAVYLLAWFPVVPAFGLAALMLGQAAADPGGE